VHKITGELDEMKLTITDTNFSNDQDWLFKLKDEGDNVFYILNAEHYRQLDLKSPITLKQLHYCYRGNEIEAEATEYDTRKIVTSVFEYALS
jgi:hypothetical protein